MVKTRVLVVGAGPVGLTLAMDLASRGISVTVVETRSAGEPPSVKCNHVSSRSMEIFRRLGLAQKLRDTGLPADYPNDCSYRTTATGIELSRILIPCRRDRYTATGGPGHRLADGRAAAPHQPDLHGTRAVRARRRHRRASDSEPHRVRGFQRSAMTASLRPSGTSIPGPTSQIHADFIVGCDGARSLVRKAIDANLQGTPIIQRVQSTYIHAPGLLALMDAPAWMTLSLNPRRCGTVVAIDGREKWLIHNHLNREDETFESVDRDASIRAILGVGPDFEYEILSKEDWVGRRLVADRFRKGRAFICGDAAHLWMPYAGYGMNAGIADATNLAWLLAAYLQGWAGIAILDAYEAERLPITEQVSRFAMEMAGKVLSQRRTVPDEIEQPGPEGDAVRKQVGQAAYDLNVQQYCCAGLNFGYFYDRSPIIAYDGAEQPGFTMADFTPSSTPGCRLPFAKLADGRPVYDALGPGYTLLRYDPDVAVAPLADAMRANGVPFAVVDIPKGEAQPPDGRKLIFARTDQHVAWRGDALPDDPAHLVSKLLGRSANPGRA